MKILLIVAVAGIVVVGIIFIMFRKQNQSSSNGQVYNGCLVNDKNCGKHCVYDDHTKNFTSGCKENECFCGHYKRIVKRKDSCRYFSDYYNTEAGRKTFDILAEMWASENGNN